MQAMRARDGEIIREFVTGHKTEITKHFDERRAELEAQGYTYVGRGKVGKNAPCPCESGRKFKHCCVSLVKRVGGATFFRGRVVDETEEA